MIRCYIPGFTRPTKEVRYGDVQVLIDERKRICLVIDGGCGKGTDKLISYLKRRKLYKVYLAVSHAHYDHTYGIRKIINDDDFIVLGLYCYDPDSLKKGLSNNKGSNEVRDDIANMKTLLSEAKVKKIKIKYLEHGDKVTLGSIKFNVYRRQPSRVADDDTNGWDYVNNGSLCFYFYELYYWTSGDGSESIYEFIKSLGIKVVFFKIPHHGNNCNKTQAIGLRKLGALYCWYNDLEPKGIGTTGFTEFGARRCKENGLHVFETVGDLNWIAQSGKLIIYKGGKKYQFDVPYQPKTVLKQPTIDIIRNTFMGKYDSSDTRTSNLLDIGYYPNSVQTKVNLVIKVAKQIINKEVNYGANQTRLDNLDKKYGIGYGQLIQDEINSLLGAKSKKW